MSARDLLLLNSVSDLKIGDPLGGGFYAGMIKDSPTSNNIYRLIIAPKSAEKNLAWHTTTSSADVSVGNFYTGTANASRFTDSSFEAGWYCNNLTIDGYSDWYLPARDELELMYRNFRTGNFVIHYGAEVPRLDGNGTYLWNQYREDGPDNGVNPVSVPPGPAYTDTSPAVTTIPNFRVGEAQAFAAGRYWSSTPAAGASGIQASAWYQVFFSAYQGTGLIGSLDPTYQDPKYTWKPAQVTDLGYIRPVRRILV